MTPWEIRGRELVNCNCSYGCPCQFNALPTQGFCEAVATFLIEEGHYGDVRLDGLAAAMVVHWPGPIHLGQGKCQPVIDSKASPEQRDALLQILAGKDTDPFATVFSVFATTFDNIYEPITAPAEVQIDVESRRSKIRFGNCIEVIGEPIRNPVTGQEHRARIELPHGFEYEIAEIGSGTAHSKGNVAVDVQKTYAQFAYIHLNNHGVVRHRAVA